MIFALRCCMVAAAIFLGGCSGHLLNREAQLLNREGLSLIEDGRYEQGLKKLEEAAKANPGDLRLRMSLLSNRERVQMQILAAANSARESGDLREAEANYRRVLAIAPGDIQAREGLRLLEKRDLHGELVRQAQAALKSGDLEQADSLAMKVLSVNARHPGAQDIRAQVERARATESMVPPQLKSRLTKPVSLEFRDANVKMVFDVLSRTSGINFILDKEVKSDTKVTIYVRNVAVEDAIDLVLVQSQFEKKVLSDNSVLIYPNTPQKIREYQDLVIRSFYLVNSDAKQTANVLKDILKLKDMHVDDRLNMIYMRDTPDTIRLAEKLIKTQDLADPEVVLEMEVLEINRTRALELGVNWPDTFTWLVPNPNGITINDLPFRQHTSGSRIGINASMLLRLRGDRNIADVISNPRIRVKNRDKARVLVGDRVPIITSTVTPGALNPVTTESISYLDVGLKLEVEPLILLDDDVSIKVALEVSTLGESVSTRSGSLAFRVGTRSINTSLRLKDGETQVLMGLIRDEERNTASGVPGLMDLPVLGRLFSVPRNERQKTEIVLSITPHIVRNLIRPDAHELEFWSGTDLSMKTRRPIMQSVAAVGGAAPLQAPTTASQQDPVPPAAAQHAQRPEPEAVATAAPAPQSATAQPLQLSWQAPQSARVGQQIVVEMMALAPSPLVSTAVTLKFDPAALEVLKVEEGDFLKQANTETRFNHTVDSVGGRLAVGIAREGSDGVQGKGRLFNVTFRVKAASPKSQIQLSSMSPLGSGNAPMQFSADGPLSISLQP